MTYFVERKIKNCVRTGVVTNTARLCLLV